MVGEPGIEVAEEPLHPRAPPCHQLRDLRDAVRSGQRPPGESPGLVAEGFGHGQEAVDLEAVLPHGHQRPVTRVHAHERRLGVGVLQVPAYGHRFADGAAVVELQNRNGAPGVEPAKRFREMLAVAQVHLHGGDVQTLLGDEDAYPARARRGAAIVELHVGVLNSRLEPECRIAATWSPGSDGPAGAVRRSAGTRTGSRLRASGSR